MSMANETINLFVCHAFVFTTFVIIQNVHIETYTANFVGHTYTK